MPPCELWAIGNILEEAFNGGDPDTDALLAILTEVVILPRLETSIIGTLQRQQLKQTGHLVTLLALALENPSAHRSIQGSTSSRLSPKLGIFVPSLGDKQSITPRHLHYLFFFYQ
jgi:hypothetical protein